MTDRKLSVVVPFYDEFAYLERCLGSLLAAGDAVSEILLVSDAADPEAAALLAPFEGLEKLRILHNDRNMGAGNSRNRGIEAARGDYLLFLDADDLVSPAGLNEALAFACSTEAEIVHLPSLIYEPSSGAWWKHFRDETYFGRRKRHATLRDLPELRYAVANWSLLYDRDLLLRENVRFDPEQRVAEDHLFLIEALQPAKRIATFDRWCHLWRRRGGSLSQKDPRLETHRIKLASLQKSLAFMGRHMPVDDIDFQRDYVFGLLRFIYGWDFISDLLTRRDEPEALALLEGLAAICADYPLLKGMENDRIVRGMTPDGRLRTCHDKIVDWPVLHAIHAALAARDWQSLESWFIPDPQTPVQLPVVHGAHECRPLRRNEGLPLVLGTAGAQTLIHGCAKGILRLQLDDPMAALSAEYRIRTAEGDRRAFNQFVMDEVDAFARFPGQVLSAAQAAGIAVSIVISPPEGDSAVTLRPDPENMDDPAVPQELRDAVTAMQQVLCTRLVPGVDNVDMIAVATRATRAMIFDHWRRDIGTAAEIPAAVGPVLGKGMLGLVWQMAETALPTAQPPSESFLKILDRQRFGDGGADGRRTIKRRLKRQLGRLWDRTGIRRNQASTT